MIDQTRYAAFLRNPEFWRLRYQKNLSVSRDKLSYGLARGTAFHIIADETHKGSTAEATDKLVRESVADGKAITKAKAMHNSFARKYQASASIVKIASEVEFRTLIPDSTHEIAGRIDEILHYNGDVWCGETKTANMKADYGRLVYDWSRNPQADFEILGAQSLGYPVKGVLVRTVTEHSPPRIWEIEATRTPDQLKVLLYNVHQVCETISMYINTFGIENPWPHSPYCYPCNMEDRCEFAEICGKPTPLVPPDKLAQFVPRVEHLPILVRP